MAMDARHVVETTVRDAYGRLLSYLAVNWRDYEAVQDALADALLAALQDWPRTGVPDKPEAWLLTTARRRLIDRARRERISERALPALYAVSEEARRLANAEDAFPDERLKMLFLCAHPAIDPQARTPLMLQTVLGIDARRMASAFAVKPSTMGQRLTRAKAKIRAERLAFVMPDADQWPLRLEAVLEAIYAAYGSGWDEGAGTDSRRKGLAREAVYLGRLLVKLMPEEPEALGLLALMLHNEARRDARRDGEGNYVPLSEQDTSRWSAELMAEAERCLRTAAQSNRMGKFQLQAAIQSVHSQRARTGRVEWEAVVLLYEGLAQRSPTLGALVGRAAAAAEAYGTQAGLALLEAIPSERIATYQPYWAVAAHLWKQANRLAEARAAYSRAIGLSEDMAVKRFLAQQAMVLS